MTVLLKLSVFLTILIMVSAAALQPETDEFENSSDVQVGHNLTLTVGNKRFHIYSDIKKNWFEAWTYCKLQKQVFATVDNKQQKEKLAEFIEVLGDKREFWIGGNNFASGDRDTYLWMATGFPTSRESGLWCASQPNNSGGNQHCLSMSIPNNRNGCWDDLDCLNAFAFICETNIS